MKLTYFRPPLARATDIALKLFSTPELKGSPVPIVCSPRPQNDASKQTRLHRCIFAFVFSLLSPLTPIYADDPIRHLQQQAVQHGSADWGYWGAIPDQYTHWGNHSNRLIPIWTFGSRNQPAAENLVHYTGPNSRYRAEDQLAQLYGRVPEETLNNAAEYCDQTDLFRLQEATLAAGRKHIILVVFDGMDWQTMQAAAIYKQQALWIAPDKPTGLHFLDYQAKATAEQGFMVTSPHNEGTIADVDTQTVRNPGGLIRGGYSARRGGATPWAEPTADNAADSQDLNYLIAANTTGPKHIFTDSSSSATSMTAGIKTFNGGLNVTFDGVQVRTIVHAAQDLGYGVGIVSSVPISHATPAATYAHNVDRDDYQDIARDLLGLPSISHPSQPLPGLDVVIGGGFGTEKTKDKAQGANFAPGNVFLADNDLEICDITHGGQYVVAKRTAGVNGAAQLAEAAKSAAADGHRLLGFYGVGAYKGHLPFATADGDYQPTIGRSKIAESYSPADLSENPTLPQMTAAALEVLSANPQGFWLMVEAGDVDWANHDNNLDNSIGSVIQGDLAVKTITDWVEKHSSWVETLVIVTADHGHYLHLVKPSVLVTSPAGN
jgi:alkaline phosphatase